MGSRGASSASNDVIKFTETQQSMQKKFEYQMRKSGQSSFSLIWGNATPEQKSKLAAAQNLAAENVFGEQGHVTSDNMYISPKKGKRFRKATFTTRIGGRISVTVSENPTEKELRGARAIAYQRSQ